MRDSLEGMPSVSLLPSYLEISFRAWLKFLIYRKAEGFYIRFELYVSFNNFCGNWEIDTYL